MARRATSSSKKQTRAAAKSSEPVAAETPRRGRKAKAVMPEQVEPSLADSSFPGGQEAADTGAEIGASPPAKARRGHKPKAHPDAGMPATLGADTVVDAKNAALEVVPSSGDVEQSDVETDSIAVLSESPRKTRRRRRDAQGELPTKASTDAAAASQQAHSSAARWDANTGTTTFDWPAIEQVAASDGPNQAMAKLLLAARAEGADSPWPF
jgi:hypothetical protein